MTYLYLAIAIVAETVATSALKASAEFSRLWPSVLVVSGYAISFYFMTLVLRVMPVGITYAIWSGVGIVLVTLAGVIIYRQIPDLAALVGIALIIAGVIIINLFSKTVQH